MNPPAPTIICPECAGTRAASCVDCRGSGRLRAQLVLTVANPETGQAASASLGPGALEPVRNLSGRWRLPLGELIVDLAGQAAVAAVTLHEPDTPQRAIEPSCYDIYLPADWQPDLPARRRDALEARALARGAGRGWIVLIGQGRAPAVPDHARLLGRLCAVADQLRVDLVIDARPDHTQTRLAWEIRLAHPGAPPPAQTCRTFDDLLTALAGTTIERAAGGLDQPGPEIPAHFIAPTFTPAATAADAGRDDTGLPTGPPDVDQLERRVMRDCEQAAGAQAIWRDRRWWHTTLQPTETPAGPPVRPHAPALRRAWEPPAPAHRGEPIPATGCGLCAGTGTREHRLPCDRCRGNGRLYHGIVLTVTDLRGRYVHLNWRPDDTEPPAALVATYASGVPTLQLAARYRVARWATTSGVRPHDLTSIDGERVVFQHLRDGIVDLTDPTADPVRTYLTRAAAGLPAARLIVRANDWPGPGLADLARLALALGLGIEITAVDHRLNAGDPHLIQGVHWRVDLVDPGTPIGQLPEAYRHSVPEAVAYCLRYLGSALAAAVPHQPNLSIRIPQHPKPVTGHLADLLAAPDAPQLTDPVRRLAAAHPGRPATARLDPTGYRTTVAD